MSGATEHAVVAPVEQCPRVVDASRVAAVRERMPDAATVQDVADAFRVLAEPARLRIVLALLEAGELCVCDVAAAAEMSETSTSQHLRVLRASRSVRKRRDGRIAYYSLADGHVRMLIDVALEHSRHDEHPHDAQS